MVNYITRKIQLTGGSTYIVSLPKEWVKALSLKAGDEVQIMEDSDLKLVVIPKNGEKKDTDKRKILLCENMIVEAIAREFIAYYMAGYSQVTITCKKMKGEDRAYIKDVVRKRLLGAEVIEEDVSSLTVQFLINEKDLPITKAISRAYAISHNMLKDALVSIESQDLEIAKEILGRDDEVDRFFFYVARQLTLSVSSLNILTEEGYNLTQVVDLYSIVKSIERVADHASRIAENIPYTEKLQHRSDVLEVGKMSMEFYEKSISGFLNQRKEMSHEVIGSNMRTFEKVIRTADLLLAEERDVKATSSGIMILDSFRRVMRYSIDIAEATIDLISKTIEASRTSES
ncbi:phosphate signaling complex PhoU family protein [Sulfuracidifex tepidarius]|uniref:SpoVT-AbrB domain-containing protein n=1 Tax=Sulfuracidifex tepidarius TaxID=1294262 RepID=A0A510E2R0_9CREN|nr:phosphate uptake regulator PhoU [Sulfuracidifex tepidarius]BBG24038.1 hypothetical protein IC006_1339 [Sulfuracidifex tepidarius]BBG26793.1 hypothetical protein IC007_1314 [Sulfuracidifex tepidarius]